MPHFSRFTASESKIAQIYGSEQISERHRHRYEFNNAYRERYAAAGFIFSGTSTDGKLVEMIELQNHPFYLATQAHPEFQSKPSKAHPLFAAFIGAALRGQRRRGTRRKRK